MKPAAKPRHFVVTGQMVLMCMLGFFGVVVAVNGAMIWAAKSTFGGLETDSSYRAGLYFNKTIAKARAQAARQWQVNGTIVSTAGGQAALNVSARDHNGLPLAGLTAFARLAHPADARLDHAIPLGPLTAGEFRGTADVPSGQWQLIIDLYRGDERLFRSRSRVTLR
jgi:nitrogen fixation protein FixH